MLRPTRLLPGASLLLLLVLLASPAASAADARKISPAGTYSGVVKAGTGLPPVTTRYGIAAGEFVIQPRFFTEGAYSTNFFRVDSRNTADPVGVFALHLRPGFAIFNPDFRKIAVNFGVDADARLPFSSDDAASEQRDVGVEAGLDVTFWPKGVLALKLVEQFDRTLWMRPTGTDENANRNRNRAGADLTFQPGGRALTVGAGYRYEVQRYDDLGTLDTDRHNLSFNAAWKFYPLTRAFLKVDWELLDYAEGLTAEERAAAGTYVPGRPLKAWLGVGGYLTQRVAAEVRVGYGNSFLAREQENFSSVLASAQVTLRFTARTALHFGGSRDFDIAPLGGYYDMFRGYAALDQGLGDVALFHLDFSVDRRRYGLFEPADVTLPGEAPTTVTASDDHRTDVVLRGGLLLDFYLTRIVGITLGYRYESDLTDYALTVAGNEVFQGYDEHRIFGTLNLRY